MATYEELHALADNETLRRKIRIACMVAADSIRTESAATPNHAARLVWARDAFANIEGVARDVFWGVIVQNAFFFLTSAKGYLACRRAMKAAARAQDTPGIAVAPH